MSGHGGNGHIIATMTKGSNKVTLDVAVFNALFDCASAGADWVNFCAEKHPEIKEVGFNCPYAEAIRVTLQKLVEVTKEAEV